MIQNIVNQYNILFKGRLSVSQFQNILQNIIDRYEANRKSKERKVLIQNRKMKVSTLMIFLAEKAKGRKALWTCRKNKLILSKLIKISNFNIY